MTVRTRSIVGLLASSLTFVGCADGPNAEQPVSAAATSAHNVPDFDSATWIAPTEIEQVHDVFEMPNGSVAVSDVSQPAVYLLDSLGRSPRRVGSKGSGPGEYLEPRRVTAYRGDSTLIIDRRQGRYIVLDPGGSIVRTEPLHPAAVSSSNVVVGDGKGRLYFPKSAFIFDSAAKAGVPLRRVTIGSDAVDSIGVLRPVATTRSQSKDADGKVRSFMTTIVPFSPEDDWAIASDGALAVVRAEPYRIEWLLPDGSWVTGPTMSFDAIAVTKADREGWEDSPIPATKPAFVASYSFTDPFGRVWVRHYSAEGVKTRRWTLFDRKGLRVTQVEFPEKMSPVHAGRRGVYVVRRDEDDLERLELHRWK